MDRLVAMENNVGQVAWSQLSVMTKMACGAREAVLIENGVRFRAGREMRISIVLHNDTYTVEAFRIKRGSFDKIVLGSWDDVYADNLNEIVYSAVNKR